MIVNKEVVTNLKSEFGEAFYLLDSKQFRQNFTELKEAFSKVYPNFNIAYSYKTNYIPKLCKIVNELGGYAEVVSEMELELALRCRVEPKNIIWNGPIKNSEKLNEYLLLGVTVNIDSADEAEYIKILAEKTSRTLNVGIRCNYDVGDGVVSRFGLDVDGDDFQKVLFIVTNTPNIHFVNFHCHFAKRQIEFWPARANGMITLIEKFGIIPERIDIGGGLFGKMDDLLKQQFNSEIPDYNAYAKSVATIFADYFKDKELKPELLIEPGSAIVGDCMNFVGTIKTIKNIRGKIFASILGSQNNISMNSINPPISIIHMGEEKKTYKNLNFVGYTCIEGDVIHRNYSGELALGDAILIKNCGSYSLVMKPPFILPNFPVLDISGKEFEVIKQAETFEDIFHTFIF
jgi:diaminopimelate decarboxylase